MFSEPHTTIRPMSPLAHYRYLQALMHSQYVLMRVLDDIEREVTNNARNTGCARIYAGSLRHLEIKHALEHAKKVNKAHAPNQGKHHESGKVRTQAQA